MNRTTRLSGAARALLHVAFLGALVTQSAGCLLEPDGDCPPGANPKEHACQARVFASADASQDAADGGAGTCPPSATFVDGVATLAAGPSTTQGSCGGAGPESFHELTAPQTGTYAFFTQDSSFDPVLYVRRDTCHGAEIACNDDGDEGVESRLTVHLTAGDRVTLVVDGYSSGASGSYRLMYELQ